VTPEEAEGVLSAVQAELGKETRVELGAITRHLIQRFAISVGETNPLYHDHEYARSQGYDDVIAPPTMVSSILVWEPGPPEPALRVDGTVVDNIVPVQGFRRMGGGQTLEFVSSVVAGDQIIMVRRLVDVVTKETRNGLLVLIGSEKRYLNQEGQVRVICRETLIVR
jgi:acyl dehydratase